MCCRGAPTCTRCLALIGPIRAGKGTIARMLTKLVGKGNVAGPTLASLGTNFGLSPLLGKPLAIISDARLGSAPSHTVVERLLSITGEDMLTIDRKYREPYTGRLPTRFVMVSNELPRFTDSSGAIATRMLILQLTKSFLDREDRTIESRLVPDMPGILNWALDGLDRLTRNGRFTVPESSRGGRHHDDGPGLAGVGVRAGAVRAGAGQDRRQRPPVSHLEDVGRIERASRRSKDHLRQVSACRGAGVGQSRHSRRRQAGARLPGNRAPRRDPTTRITMQMNLRILRRTVNPQVRVSLTTKNHSAQRATASSAAYEAQEAARDEVKQNRRSVPTAQDAQDEAQCRSNNGQQGRLTVVPPKQEQAGQGKAGESGLRDFTALRRHYGIEPADSRANMMAPSDAAPYPERHLDLRGSARRSHPPQTAEAGQAQWSPGQVQELPALGVALLGSRRPLPKLPAKGRRRDSIKMTSLEIKREFVESLRKRLSAEEFTLLVECLDRELGYRVYKEVDYKELRERLRAVFTPESMERREQEKKEFIERLELHEELEGPWCDPFIQRLPPPRREDLDVDDVTDLVKYVYAGLSNAIARLQFKLAELAGTGKLDPQANKDLLQRGLVPPHVGVPVRQHHFGGPPRA